MNRRVLLGLILSGVVSLSFVICPEVALAGGGGSKAKGYIEIKNIDPAVSMAVITNPPAAWASTPPTQQQFLAAGGRILSPGQKTKFTVREGSNDVYVAAIDGDGNVLDEVVETVNVRKGKTLKLNADFDNAGTVVITVR